MHYLIDLILVGILIAVAYSGWRRGLAQCLLSYGRTVVAVIVTKCFASPVAAWLEGTVIRDSTEADSSAASRAVAMLLSVVLLFVLTVLSFTVIMRLVAKLARSTPLAVPDRVLGLVLGAVTGLFSVMLIAGLLAALLTLAGLGDVVGRSVMMNLFADFLISALEML